MSDAAETTPALVLDLETPPAAVPPPPSASLFSRLAYWLENNTMMASIAVLMLAFVAVFFWSKMIVTIPAGHEGVIWRRLTGTDVTTVFPEGTQIIFPWNKMTVYDLRLQRRDLSILVLSTDGLQINVDVSVRFHPEAKTLPRLHQSVGPEYGDRIVIPEVVTAVREIMGQYRPQQLYTIHTTEMESRIIELAARQTRDRYVTVDDVLISRITLPDIVQNAIQAKLRQEQEAEEYEYRLRKEEQEAKRKLTEATGIRDYQNMINQAREIPETTLRWRGIEATLELAKSPNAKVIVIGGRDGMPLILDTSTIAGTGGSSSGGGRGAANASAAPPGAAGSAGSAASTATAPARSGAAGPSAPPAPVPGAARGRQ